MKVIIAIVLGGALGWATPAAAQPNGAWTTLLRAFRYNDLLPVGDTVWCATQEAGLLRYLATTGTFTSQVREPGGLASNHLSVVALDRRGRLWVGTQGAGASVLGTDRRSWTLVNAFDGLPSDSVTVLEANGDTMWIGTNGGIALWNGREISGVLPDGSGASPFASNVMRGVAVIGDTVWVATANGAYRSLISTELVTWTPMNAGLRTRDLGALASMGGVLITVDSLRAYRFDPGSSTWIATPDIGAVRYLADDPGGIVAASLRGIHIWDGAGWTRVNATLSSPGQPRRDFSASRDASGRCYAANRDGLYQQPAGTGAWPVTFPVGPPGNDVLNVALDGNRFYMTTTDEGFGRYDGASWKYWFAGVSPPTDTTTFRAPAFGFALLVDRVSRKWVGCWDGALESFDDSLEPPRFKHWWTSATFCQPVCDDTVDAHTFAWVGVADSVGGRWFGMDVSGNHRLIPIGLEYYDPAGNYAANYRPGTGGVRAGKVHGLTVDRNGRIWVGYPGQGIDFFDWPPLSGSRPQLQTALATGNVQGLAAGPDAIWALTTDDLLRLDFSGDLEASYDLPAEPTDLAVHPIDIAPDGSVWVGTARGIRVFRREGPVADYTTINSPLADDAVRSIRIDRSTGVVWIGTAGGVSRLDPGFVPQVPELPKLEVQVYPNPARLSALGAGVRLVGNAAEFRGEVYDLTGRILHRFRIASGQAAWDGLGPDGRPVKPGIYWIRAEAGGRSATRRIALVR